MAVVAIDPFDFRAPFPIDLRMRRENIGERDTIPTNNRWEGMLVYVVSEQTWYGLVGGVGNENWIALGTTNDIQNVSWRNNSSPTGGDDGDIVFNDTGDNIELWFKQGGAWGMLGSWGSGSGSGGVTSVQDDSYDFSTTSVQIESDHSGLSVGSIVYSEISSLMWTKLDENKWTRSTLDIA